MMSTKDLARLTVIQGAIDGVYTVKQTTRKLGMSTRRVKHLKRTVREQRDGTVIRGNAGQHPSNVTGEAVRKKITGLKKSKIYRLANSPIFGNCWRSKSEQKSAT